MATPSRPPDPGGRRVLSPSALGSKQTVQLFCFLLLLIAAAQSQSIPDAAQHLRPQIKSRHDPSVRASDGPQPGRSPAEIPLLNIDTSTHAKFGKHETQNANTDRFNAVAPAPNAVRAPLAPRSSESQGHHSLSTARSLQDWEVESIVLLATIDGAIHARDRKTGQERWSLGVPDSPMIETTHHRQNRSGLDEQRPEDDYIFIVEPSKDGDLYIQHKNPIIGLQRLGVTVKSLADQTPSWVDDPPLATTARVETTLFRIDAASGNVLNQFSTQEMFTNNNQEGSCRKINGLELEDDSCEPFGILQIGRKQYTITIASAETNQMLCTIKYSEWVPNIRDGELQSQHLAPLDNYHIQSFHNGRIIGMDSSRESAKQYRFTHSLDSPVARVYDVFHPVENKDGTASLLVLSQPVEPLYLEPSHPWNDELTRSKVFVNQTDGGNWYALSEQSYPGVTTGAGYANIFHDWRHREPLDFEEDAGDIIGVHTLLTDERGLLTQPLIAAFPANTPNTSEESDVVAVPPAEPPAGISEPWIVLKTVVSTMLFCSVLVIWISTRKPRLLSQFQHLLKRVSDPVAVEAVIPESSAPYVVKEGMDRASKTDIAEPQLISTTPIARSRAQSTALADAIISPESPGLARRRATSEGNDNSSGGESDDEETAAKVDSNDTSIETSEPKKKKAKRGKRGGRHNKKKIQMSPETMDENETMIVQEVPSKDGMLQVGRLKLNANHDQCLGHGSNGTTVFPGTLDGRAVAVKRLLRSATSLAAKEIKHLLSSDENPHVIRYFGKEESQNFTYIALDLFTASLDQVVEHPDKYPGLVTMPQGFDVKDALRQITDGVQHLHSLKLVHRDIKPQNVLVRTVKSGRPIEGLPKLQFVISDFGLCKPLEEGPESTFAPTANHTAAGTTGWRAPELLVHSRAAVAAPYASSSASGSASHSSDGTVIDPPSGRRATKAIDIFSLGCVFYYVMTQGHHPFDVGGTSLGRDLNIKENNFTTDGLRLHLYEFDADDLVMQMIKHSPKERPDTQGVLRHPYFWDETEKLDFLCDVSDCYEREKTSITDIHDTNAIRTVAEEQALSELRALESLGPNVIGPSNDFLRALPKSFIAEMGKQRKYTGNKMIDLLRVIRNKKNHFHDLPTDVKEFMVAKAKEVRGGGVGSDGNNQVGYFRFWSEKFPSLVINCHCLILERDKVGKFGLGDYYS